MDKKTTAEVGNIWRRLGRWILCLLGQHDWTCDAEQGIPPDAKKLQANPVGYFWDYAQGYCKYCGKVLPKP